MLLFVFFAFNYFMTNMRQNHMKQQPYIQWQSIPVSKGSLSHYKRRHITRQKATFRKPKDGLLHTLLNYTHKPRRQDGNAAYAYMLLNVSVLDFTDAGRSA